MPGDTILYYKTRYSRSMGKILGGTVHHHHHHLKVQISFLSYKDSLSICFRYYALSGYPKANILYKSTYGKFIIFPYFVAKIFVTSSVS